MIHSFMRSDFVVADGRRIEASMWICDDVVQLKATIAGADGTLRAEYPSLRRRYRYDPVTIAATIDTFAGEFEALADIAVPWTLLAPVLDDATGCSAAASPG